MDNKIDLPNYLPSTIPSTQYKPRLQRCGGCFKDKPHTDKYFYRDEVGLHELCKICRDAKWNDELDKSNVDK
jgi:hypothetical protein